MPSRLYVLCCNNFHKEVAEAIAAEGWTDVVARAFPARCGRPAVSWEELRGLLPEDCGQIVVLGRSCLSALSAAPSGFPPAKVVPQEQCFHLVADPGLVNQAIADGGYLVTPGWLAEWRSRLAEMGFPADGAGEFFRDFAGKLVLFDTGVGVETPARMNELSEALGLPVTRIPVGLDHVRLLLTRLVHEWRLTGELQARRDGDRRHSRELADHVSAMDLLARLAGTRQEPEAIAAIEDVFRMLFAPATWFYVRVEHEQPALPPDMPAELKSALAQMQSNWAWTPGGQGFLLRIARGDNVLGLIVVDGLAFPEFRERYLNLALAISDVCALAIENARTHRQLAEAEKMASMGVLVAGVAHEINTPVGIGLAAVSLLEKQTETLASDFAARRMTQSGLQGYLDNTREEAHLTRTNLERIGNLIDAFRQVAVEGKAPRRHRFALRSVIDNVVASLGARLADSGIHVEVGCDDGLVIESIAADWTSIFSNLLSNSLQHGFKGREQGAIDIAAAARNGKLVVDYADDGAGMTAEVRERVFDPFFSTDLQHGMGLGMHLIFNLINHRLGGIITCASEPGKGSHFRIEVPL